MFFVVGKDASTLLMEPNKNPNELLMELDKLALTFTWKNKKRVKRETSEQSLALSDIKNIRKSL